MTFEQEVCDLEHAKQLKNYITQESLFNWLVLDEQHPLYKVHSNISTEESLDYKRKGIVILGRDPYEKMCGEFIHYPAFTATELITMLPHSIFISDREPFGSFRLRIDKRLIVTQAEPLTEKIVFAVNYMCDSTEAAGANAWLERSLFPHANLADKFANALADTLIQCFVEGYIKIGEAKCSEIAK